MIAFAITCLLVIAVALALLVSADSLMRGWHAYRALAGELRALRVSGQDRATCGARGTVRAPTMPSSRRPASRRRAAEARLRAAA